MTRRIELTRPQLDELISACDDADSIDRHDVEARDGAALQRRAIRDGVREKLVAAGNR